jgi:indolepyruvate ferredoxin oxidoreductase
VTVAESQSRGGRISRSVESRYEVGPNSVFLTGTQALVRTIFDQLRFDRDRGHRTGAFVSGYPGSPLGGFDQELARQSRLRDELGVVHVPGQNEELAATAVWGSQIATTFPDSRLEGVVGVWHAKGPGLDRASDAIRHAQFVGTAPLGGVLALVGEDPSCKSSSIPNTSERALLDLGLPILVPGGISDILELGLHGFAMSRASGLWTGVRITTAVADGTATATVGTGWPDIVVPTVNFRGRPYRPTVQGVPGQPWSAEIEAELFEPRQAMTREYGYQNGLNRASAKPDRPWLGIMAVGPMYGELVTALTTLGLPLDELRDLGIRLCHVRMLAPIDARTFREFAAGLTEIIVVEEKRPLLESAVRDSLYSLTEHPAVIGKLLPDGTPFLPVSGSLDSGLLASKLYERLSTRIPGERLRLPGRGRVRIPIIEVTRAPYFCSGCPHNISSQAPDGAMVGAGIGCHAMVQSMDPVRVGEVTTATHMGSEGAQWIGIAPFVEREHIFQNMGDGTFFHSGQLAVQAAIAAGSNITYKLLFNDAIAMTGGQSTRNSNGRPVPDVVNSLLRQGVTRIIVTTDDLRRYRGVRLPRGAQVWDRSRVVEAQAELSRTPGVTVLIHDQRCAAENRRDWKRGRRPKPTMRVVIDERICEGCGDCGTKSNCLSVEPVETEFGRKTQINQSSCNVDFSCLKGDCPSFMTVRLRDSSPPRTAAMQKIAEIRPPSSQEDQSGTRPIPAPSRIEGGSVSIRMPGIGGTGVVTAAQVLGAAALTDGMTCTGLDQTGLSQKAGPVISDLHIGPDALNHSNKLGDHSVDLLLGFDLLVTGQADVLASLKPGESRAVISLSRAPTGAMVSNVSITYPDTRSFQDAVEAELGAGRVCWVDAEAVTRAELGTPIGSNIFMIGIAYQMGSLPLSAAAIEQAITLNGVAVEANVSAFRFGRRWFAENGQAPMAPERDAAHPPKWSPRYFTHLPLPSELVAVVERHAQDLSQYQNHRYAQNYADKIESIWRAEQLVRAESGELTLAFAKGLYKLMAYKDEYEVARLCLDSTTRDRVREMFGNDAKIYWNLHPPILRNHGLAPNKLRLGTWFRPAFVVLRSMRRLRATRLDVFGYSKMRRLERSMRDEFADILDDIALGLTEENFNVALKIAALPESVTGYEDLKARRAAAYRDQLTTHVTQFRRIGQLEPQ